MPGWAVIEPEEKTKEGDIFLPEAAKSEMQRGTVAYVNASFLKDGALVEIPVSPGDKVAFVKYHDQDLEINGKKYKVVPVEKIMVILD